MIIFVFLSVAISSFNLYGREVLTEFAAEVNESIILCMAPAKHVFGYNIYLWVDLLSFNMVPSFIIALCNTCIICKVCLSSLRRQHGEGHSSRLAGMTATLMVISICHFLLSAPIGISLLLHQTDMLSAADLEFMMDIGIMLGEDIPPPPTSPHLDISPLGLPLPYQRCFL